LLTVSNYGGWARRRGDLWDLVGFVFFTTKETRECARKGFWTENTLIENINTKMTASGEVQSEKGLWTFKKTPVKDQDRGVSRTWEAGKDIVKKQDSFKQFYRFTGKPGINGGVWDLSYQTREGPERSRRRYHV